MDFLKEEEMSEKILITKENDKINEVNKFIRKVFNTFNGIINPINHAVLDINCAELVNTNAGGYSKMPNIVIINTVVIMRYNDYDEKCIKACVVETIIHELFHTDQIIDYNRYGSDADYTQYIEHSCQVMTYLFMSTNTNIINSLLGFDIDPKIYKDCLLYWDAPGVYYNRRTYIDHIFMCLSQLSPFTGEALECIYETIVESLSGDGNFILKINDDVIHIKDQYTLIPLWAFNRVLIKYSCSGNIRSDFKYESDGIDTTFIFKTKLNNLMCKTVNKQ